MGNLQTGIPGPPTAAPPPPTALLRKVQSESNLLKIKNKRERAGAGAPYSHRGANMHGNKSNVNIASKGYHR